MKSVNNKLTFTSSQLYVTRPSASSFFFFFLSFFFFSFLLTSIDYNDRSSQFFNRFTIRQSWRTNSFELRSQRLTWNDKGNAISLINESCGPTYTREDKSKRIMKLLNCIELTIKKKKERKEERKERAYLPRKIPFHP